MDRKRHVVRVAVGSLILGFIPGVSGVGAADAPTVPAPASPSPDMRAPVRRPLPAGFRFTATFLPTGFVEVSGVQSTWFTVGANGSSAREAPGLMRVWTPSASAGKVAFIIAIADKTGRNDPSITPTSLRNARIDLRVRPGSKVYMANRQGWDVRWTERGVDVRLIVQAPNVGPSDVEKFIAGIKLS